VLRILIADANEVVRSGVVRIVESRSNWNVVAIARDDHEAIRVAIESKPDIAIVGYELPSIDGVEVTRQIRAHLPRTEILIFTAQEDDRVIERLLRAGARGYVLKSDSDQLVTAIEALASRQPFFTSKVAEVLLDAFNVSVRHQPGELTHRERQIVKVIAEGYSNKEIANLLDISLKTVETHRAAVMRKLRLPTTAALVRYAIRKKLVEP
jgi:DNA-binding NarL/FixJ family response regulator